MKALHFNCLSFIAFLGVATAFFSQTFDQVRLCQENCLDIPKDLGELLIPEPLFVEGIKFGSINLGEQESFNSLVEISVLKKWLSRFPVAKCKENSEQAVNGTEVFVRTNCLAPKEQKRQQPYYVGNGFVHIGKDIFEIKMDGDDEFGNRWNDFLTRYTKFKKAHRDIKRESPFNYLAWSKDAEFIDEYELLQEDE